ncbi:MAG: hypothetical protein HY099_01345 [Nitrospirae bacterium]|nr:hypothetical protein [Nitrospirota bacterium]
MTWFIIANGKTKNVKYSMSFPKFISALFGLLLFILAFAAHSLALTDEEALSLQSALKDKTTGERIAFLAERFVGTPYDPDPMGEYVTKAAIVADERVDCMYLTFRAVELAMSATPDEAVQVALDKRFHSKGVIKNGRVINYDNRFEYGEDMICSGKWGDDITHGIGRTAKIKGSRGLPFMDILKPKELLKGIEKLQSGDIIFFIKDPKKTRADEIVGHIGIIKKEQGLHDGIYMIHASGRKGKGGAVKKILLRDYIGKMPFIGVKLTRFR